MKLAFSFALFSLLAAPASAQSVITLDDFDFGDSEPKTQPVEKESSDSMSSCLLDPTSCEDARFKSKVTFTVDDVVNINIIDREEVAETKVSTGHEQQPASQVLPSIDLEVLFDRNSSDIRSDQYPLLLDLANVLRDGEFDNYKLVFMGHTDAKGSAEYNLTLSKQRARECRAFCVSLCRGAAI